MEFIFTLGIGVIIGIGVGFFWCKNMLKHNPMKLAAIMAEAEALKNKVKDNT